MNRLWRILRVFTLLTVLTGTLSGATYPITYRLAKPGQISVSVYNANGNLVRELLCATQQSAGDHTLMWDGLDRTGKSMPAGKYTWKLLQTQGLSAQYLLRVGSNYPVGTDLSSSSGPGTHVSPYTVATDDTGIYISALQTENLETCLLKLSPDGKTRLWSQQLPFDAKGIQVAWEGALSIAVDKGEVYLLGHLNLTGAGQPQRVYVSNGANGRGVRAFDVTAAPNPGATDMHIRDGVLVVAYRALNMIRWYNPTTGALLDTATVDAPMGVAVGSNGTVYVSTSNTVVSLTQANHTLTPVITGLTKPDRLDVDRSNDDLIVYEASTRQVKRFSAAGVLMKTYGAAGGRQDGLYNNQDFAGFTDLCADGHGGFCVAEAWAAPRRVAQFAHDGTVKQEWYGGQPWDSHATFEPGNPKVMWMSSASSASNDVRYVMRLTVDYTNQTWQVHSCYKYVSPANPLMSTSANEGGFFHIYQHDGTNYLAIEGSPCISKVDEKNWKLVPVTAFGAGFQWNDADGDGLVQDTEKTSYTNAVSPIFYVSHLAADFDHYFIDHAYQVRRTRVAGWNAVGAPIYTNAPPEVYAKTPPRFNTTPFADARWGAFLHSDTVSGNLYAVLNPWTHDWCTSADSFMQQWNARQQLTWSAGELGPSFTVGQFQYVPTDPGLIYWNLRGIAGVAHGCVIAIDVNGGWTASERAHTYVWDQDGLFVGGIMDNPDLNGIPSFMYRCGGEFAHSSVYTLPNGDVLFAGNWENDVRLYKVTGWDKWVRKSGKLSVKASSADNTGQGLTAEYFHRKTFTNSRAIRVEGPIDFKWGTKKPGSVRWRGSLQPTYGPVYTGFWLKEATDTNCFESTHHRANDMDATVECKFRGASISVIGLKTANSGYANIYLDGTQVVTNLDCYSSNTVYNATLFEKSGLANDDHIVTVKAFGWLHRQHHPASSGFYISIDKFVADGVPIDDDGLPYTFSVNTAAGAQLWLDNVCAIYDWKVKPSATEKSSAPIKLLRKNHPIQFSAFKETGTANVTLSWSSALDTMQPVPTSSLFPVVSGNPIPEQNIGCVYVGTNTTTKGNWKDVYGADGYLIVHHASKYPAYVIPTASGTQLTGWGWNPGTDVRGLQSATDTNRVGAAWFCTPPNSMTYDLNFTDNNWHQFGFYTLDKDRLGLQTKFEVFDIVGQLLDSRILSSFAEGSYILWNVRGHVSIRVTPINKSSAAAILGYFFDPPDEHKP